MKILFNPEKDYENCPLKVGETYTLVRAIRYCTNEDIEDLQINPNIFKINPWGDLWLPAGTMMTYVGNNYNGWPTFVIGNEEVDFACDQDIVLEEVK